MEDQDKKEISEEETLENLTSDLLYKKLQKESKRRLSAEELKEIQKPEDFDMEKSMQVAESMDADINIEDIPEYFELNPKARQVVKFMLFGTSFAEIARRTNLSVEIIRQWRQNPKFQRVLEKAGGKSLKEAISNSGNVRKYLDRFSVRAVLTLGSILGGLTEEESLEHGIFNEAEVPLGLKKATAKDLLEMAGHKAPQHVEIKSEEEHQIVVSDPAYDPENDPFIQNHPEKEKILYQIRERKFDPTLEEDDYDEP